MTISFAASIARTTLRGALAGGIAKPSFSFALPPGVVTPVGAELVPPIPTPPLPAPSAAQGRAISAASIARPSAALNFVLGLAFDLYVN